MSTPWYQNAPWSDWLRYELHRFYWSFRRQWCRWRMWHYPTQSEEFKARFREAIRLADRLR